MSGFRSAIFIAVLISPGMVWADGFDEVLLTSHNLFPGGQDSLIRDVCQVCHIEPIQDISPRVADALPIGLSIQMPGEDAADLIAESAPLTDLTPVAVPLWNSNNSGQFFLPLPDVSFLVLGNGKEHRPFGPSLKCLTCHDGVLGNDVHRAVMRVNLTREADLDEKLTRSPDHPSSISYPRKPSGDFAARTTTKTLSRYWSIPDRNEKGVAIPDGPMSASLMPENVNLEDPLQASTLIRTFLGTMHCDSCHNPHLNLHRPFLRVSSKDLCLTCHQR